MRTIYKQYCGLNSIDTIKKCFFLIHCIARIWHASNASQKTDFSNLCIDIHTTACKGSHRMDRTYRSVGNADAVARRGNFSDTRR